MEQPSNIIGFYVSSAVSSELSEAERLAHFEKGKIISSLIWGVDGIDNLSKALCHKDYGENLKLILFQLLIKPLPEYLVEMRKKSGYRKREKSYAHVVTIDDNNFFQLSREAQKQTLASMIVTELKTVFSEISQLNLDTNGEKLSADFSALSRKWTSL